MMLRSVGGMLVRHSGDTAASVARKLHLTETAVAGVRRAG
jgi:hypothetical protein